ncbi:MAG: hypothetical protein ACRDQU_07830 [Pseudonocardiaceae bacterium]
MRQFPTSSLSVGVLGGFAASGTGVHNPVGRVPMTAQERVPTAAVQTIVHLSARRRELGELLEEDRR